MFTVAGAVTGDDHELTATTQRWRQVSTVGRRRSSCGSPGEYLCWPTPRTRGPDLEHANSGGSLAVMQEHGLLDAAARANSRRAHRRCAGLINGSAAHIRRSLTIPDRPIEFALTSATRGARRFLPTDGGSLLPTSFRRSASRNKPLTTRAHHERPHRFAHPSAISRRYGFLTLATLDQLPSSRICCLLITRHRHRIFIAAARAARSRPRGQFREIPTAANAPTRTITGGQ